MSHYQSNLRDIRFNLYEVFGREALLGTGPARELDRETADTALTEMDHLCRTKLSEAYAEGDRNPPVYDSPSHTVTLPESTKMAYKAYMDSDWWRLELREEMGGVNTPPSLRWAVLELILTANPAIYMYSAGPKFAQLAYDIGCARDRKIARHMIERQWAATMVLTEPDAGSDVGAGRTKALPQPDGTWHIEGVKRFITSGEHDLAENIVHLVLARPVGAAPGTKGLSLFLVPKWHFDPETGQLTGERNGVHATNLEKKMGLKVSSTCELTFGAEEPAVGWLLGEVRDGIAQMFHVIEHARMLVGTKAMATLSTGYLNALAYAKTRVQGVDLTAPGKDAPRVTITHHPDVRRSLMTQKSTAEALRMLIAYTATWQDRVWLAESRGDRDELADRVNDLLLPIVKGYGSERAWILLGSESLQTLGGSGFLQDYPLEQYVRDAKIDTLYEGTTAIQGQDLFFRKIIRDRGVAMETVSVEMKEWLAADGPLSEERALLARGAAECATIIDLMTRTMATSADQPEEIYKVGLNTTRLLMCLGDLICSWLMLRAGEIAHAALRRDDLRQPERDFYAGKLAAARWFARTRLPGLTAERKLAESMDLAIMDLPESAF